MANHKAAARRRFRGAIDVDKAMAVLQTDAVVVGGASAGIVTALELLRAGQRVVLVDRDTPERLGGLALWAFGGMALVGTPLQEAMGIPTRLSGPCMTGCSSASWTRRSNGRCTGRATTSSIRAARCMTG